MKRWSPPVKPTRREELLLKRLTRTRKLFGFLRLHRHEIFTDEFQQELEGMYRRTGAGAEPHPPAVMCLALVLQGYLGTSDAEAVEMTVVDARWQLVLDCLGAEEPLFSQGALQQFRERLIAADMDRRLLERTIEVARESKGFDWKKLPKDLRVAVDSRPFDGAGRVEDTVNLLGHGARKLAEGAARLLDLPLQTVCKQAGIPVLLHPSVKAGLDVNWSDPEEKDAAIDELTKQVAKLVEWLRKKKLEIEEPLRPYLEAVVQVQEQDLEKRGDGTTGIRQGVAPDRRISIEDSEMRHGRKSRSKRFNGYKEHIAVDLDSELVLACAVTPANRPEEEATPELEEDIDRLGRKVAEAHVDRAYINSTLVDHVLEVKGEVVAKPWSARNNNANLFKKSDFKFNMRDRTITCPAGQVEPFEPGDVVQFDPEVCGACPLRAQCTLAASGRGRSVSTSRDEALQQRLRKLQKSSSGRARMRQRVHVEHQLARMAARQGPKARYRGVRKNLFDARRAAAISNLETIHRKASGAG